MQLQKKILSGFLALITGTVTVSAQNNTSPYSIIGIGDIEKSSFDRTSGMGHAGLALSSNRFLYQANPASFAKMDEHFFYAEVSSRYKSVNYSGKPITDPANGQSSDIQFKKMVIAIKPLPKWAISVGLLPFSTANYSFAAQKSIQGSNLTADAYYEGSGSTNLFYVTNAFNVTKNLYIGLQASYLFGQLQEKETLGGDITDSSLVTTRNIFLGNPYLKLGVQYRFAFNRQLDIALGATISNKTKLQADYGLLVKNGYSTIINNEYYKTNYFSIPLTYSGGIAAIYKNAYTVAVDYQYQGWSTLNYTGINYALVNSQRLSVGGEYAKKIPYLNQFIEKYFLQTGFFYSNSYLRIAGQQLADYGATFGGGLQLARSGMGLQGAIEIGKRGTTDNGLIKENYTQFSVTLSYRDFWISRKMKKYD